MLEHREDSAFLVNELGSGEVSSPDGRKFREVANGSYSAGPRQELRHSGNGKTGDAPLASSRSVDKRLNHIEDVVPVTRREPERAENHAALAIDENVRGHSGHTEELGRDLLVVVQARPADLIFHENFSRKVGTVRGFHRQDGEVVLGEF